MRDNFYRTRGYLPHLENRGSTYFITLRLAATLPIDVLNEIRVELKTLRKERQDRKLNSLEERRLRYLETQKIQDYLDKGLGECWLREPAIAELVQEAVLHHDGQTYDSHVCCIMPNHLHWIFTPKRQKGMGKLDSRIIPISNDSNLLLLILQTTFFNGLVRFGAGNIMIIVLEVPRNFTV